jgi:cyclic-di-AMP phosphodiesterase PgpH
MILIVAMATRLDLARALLLAIGSTVAILQLDEIRSRSKLIRVGFLAGLAFFVVVWAEALWTREVRWSVMERITQDAGLAFIFGLLPGFVILGILPFIERLFGVVTSISLLELCDVNQPALRNLAIRAPGTYSHSLLLGSLVEPAAEALGANGLLARVGAYFHDIGKVNKPHYFVENALGKTEAHEGLTPAMSRLVITSHVKDGLEMADRLGLPRYIRQFIAEHHGTTVMEYFYHEAEVQAERTGGEPPHDTDYRYPGPKPRSRETAIVMLADTVEGTTRALKDPTAARVQATVHEMVMKRLMDGQLDQSGLTLSDLHKIDETLTKALLSVYHTRVPYPTDRPVPEASGEGTKKEEPGGLKGAWRA